MKKLILLSLLILVTMSGCLKQYRIPEDELKRKFLQLCDTAVKQLNLPKRKYASDSKVLWMPFYVDSYAVRALAVAYDMTGNEDYFDAIKTWSDRMIKFQEKMIPYGAYYMNYDRAPFQTAGNWYNCDCGSIAMGVLATAVRCTNPIEKNYYLKSVESYATLVLENYIGPNGGIRNGLWPDNHDEYYCCSGTVGSTFFLLYNETGNDRYIEAGLNAVNWLSRLDLINDTNKFVPSLKRDLPSSKKRMSSETMMYFLEAFSAGLPYIISKKYPEVEKLARKQIALLMKWNSENLGGKGSSGTFEKYDVRQEKVGGKFGGLPFHIYIHKGIIDNKMIRIADMELKRIVTELFERDEHLLTEFACFSMMSMAERISPGSIYRKSKPLYKLLDRIE